MNHTAYTDFYNDYWSERDKWMPNPSLTPLQRQLFTRLITRDTIVLDVGCGDGGHYGRELATIAREYHGLDVSPAAVETARQNGIRAQQHDLAQPFPFNDKVFDTVICIEVLEHLFNPALALGEMRRVLKLNGRILLSVPNTVHIANRVRVLLGGFSPGGTPETSSRRPWADPHIRFFTARSLRAFVVEQGLRPSHLYGEGFSLFSTFPFFSSIAARLLGWERLERWSQPFEFMARWYPSLCAGHLFAVATHESS